MTTTFLSLFCRHSRFACWALLAVLALLSASCLVPAFAQTSGNPPPAPNQIPLMVAIVDHPNLPIFSTITPRPRFWTTLRIYAQRVNYDYTAHVRVVYADNSSQSHFLTRKSCNCTPGPSGSDWVLEFQMGLGFQVVKAVEVGPVRLETVAAIPVQQ